MPNFSVSSQKRLKSWVWSGLHQRSPLAAVWMSGFCRGAVRPLSNDHRRSSLKFTTSSRDLGAPLPAASLDLRWKDSLSASQRHRRRHRLCNTSCPSAPAQQLLRVAPGLRRLSSPRNLHLPFPPLSLLGLSSREGVHAQPDTTPLRSARAPDPR